MSGDYIAQLLAMDTAVLDAASLERELKRSLLDIPLLVSAPPLNIAMARNTSDLFSLIEFDGVNKMGLLESLLCSSYDYVIPSDASEEDFASAADSLTGQAWCRFDDWRPTLLLRSARNSADPSGATAVGARPDYCLWVHGHLMLKAEHKRTESDFTVAVTELASKMLDWDVPGLRQMPLLPCFAVGGKWLQFFALTRPPAGATASDAAAVPVSAMFDMRKPSQRVAIIHASLNMFRVFAFLRRSLPSTAARLYQRISRGDGSFLQIMGTSVTKVCKTAAPPAVYEWLIANPHASMVRIQSAKPSPQELGFWKIVLSPVCVEVLPTSEAELRDAVRNVLSALCAFHTAGFVHRDVRWPNILRSSGTWLLADFELSATAGAHLPANAIADVFLPPEVLAGNAPYGAPGDIYCVGRLLDSVGLDDLTGAARSLSERCCRVDPLDRPSASTALTDVWFTS